MAGDAPGDVDGGGAEPLRRVEPARAYTGPAHGTRWTVDAARVPARVQLDVDGWPVAYRLVLRADGQPARDSARAHLYVPDTADDSGEA